VVGSARGITIIDDFAHNPDKVAATLAAASALPGRLLIFFQPHGYGPLKQMGKELAASFAGGMRTGDKLFVCDPVYFGGSVDRSVDSKAFVFDVIRGGGYAVHMSRRDSCGEALVTEARPGDRILILGARDDTLTDFAQGVLAAIGA
jgi:UDP-N-acetylmuramate--alanine ligase